jgi:hypothetical protein
MKPALSSPSHRLRSPGHLCSDAAPTSEGKPDEENPERTGKLGEQAAWERQYRDIPTGGATDPE